MKKIEILTKDYNITNKYMNVKINFRYDGQIYEYDRRDSNCELDDVELFTKIKDEKQNTVYNFTIYNGIGSYEYVMKMDKNLINEAFFDKLKEEGLVDQITDYKDYDEIINKKEDYKIEFIKNNYKNKNCNGKMIEEYDFKFVYKNHAYGVYITNEINKDYSEKTAHLLQYNNDTVRLLALHSLDSLKVGKEVQIKSFDKDGNELSEFSGKLYNVRCPIYNKYLKNKKLLNVYVNDDVKTYYEDSVVIYDNELNPDYSFMDNKISKLSIEDIIKNSKKENLFIIRSLSEKILYVFSYNRYDHCFTTIDSKTMHRFFIDDKEIILYNIKFQFVNKYKIEDPYELSYHINFEEYY